MLLPTYLKELWDEYVWIKRRRPWDIIIWCTQLEKSCLFSCCYVIVPLALLLLWWRWTDLLKSGRTCKGIDTYFGGTILLVRDMPFYCTAFSLERGRYITTKHHNHPGELFIMNPQQMSLCLLRVPFFVYVSCINISHKLWSHKSQEAWHKNALLSKKYGPFVSTNGQQEGDHTSLE